MANKEKLIEMLNNVQRGGAGYDEFEYYGLIVPNTIENDIVADSLMSQGVIIAAFGEIDIKISNYIDVVYVKEHCSVCGEQLTIKSFESDYWNEFAKERYERKSKPFCPACGARLFNR